MIGSSSQLILTIELLKFINLHIFSLELIEREIEDDSTEDSFFVAANQIRDAHVG